MEHIAFAALILWAASTIVCLHGSLQGERESRQRDDIAWDYLMCRYEEAKQQVCALREALFERERDLNALARAQVELRAPDCLGRTIVVNTTLQQWRLIEDIMGKEARIQRRPELEPPYLVLTGEQYSRAMHESCCNIWFMADERTIAADARLGAVYYDRIPVHVER